MQVLKESVRKKILKSARKEFMKYGYEGANMRRIMEKAGFTVGLCYRYYQGKEDLFYAVTGGIKDPTAGLAVYERELFCMLVEKKFGEMGMMEVIKRIPFDTLMEVIET